MTIPAVHCEARKVAYRQTKDGLVVSFVIHPNDMPDALAVAPLGQRYMLAMAAIGDDERPMNSASPATAECPGEVLASEPQSAPLRREPTAGAVAASQRGKERYASASPMDQAVIRAARLSDDERFCAWAGYHSGLVYSKDEAIEYIRNRCCMGGSRGLIGEDPACHQRFLAMETEYKIAVGEMAEPR